MASFFLSSKAHVSPADMVACCPICLHKDGVLINVLRKIYSENVFIESKAQENGTVVPAKWDILLHREDLSCLSQFRFPGHTTRIFTTELYEAVEIIRPCQLNETCAKAIHFVSAIQTIVRNHQNWTHSLVILATTESSSDSGFLMVSTKLRQVWLASLPFWSSLISSTTNNTLT